MKKRSFIVPRPLYANHPFTNHPLGCCELPAILIREAPDTFNYLRHVMRASWSVRPKCSHRCVSLKGNLFETCANPQAHNQKLTAEQTAMRTKWFKQIAIYFKLFRRISYLRLTRKSLAASDFVAAGEAKNPAISAAELLRARLRPPWSLRFCDAIFVLLSLQCWEVLPLLN